MAKDFRASQIETSKIILSGGVGSKLGAIVYSGSKSTNRTGGIPAEMIAKVGDDVMLFVSGNIGGKDSDTGSVTLFGGDVVVSGTMYMEQMVTEVTRTISNDHYVSGSLIIGSSNTGEPDISTHEPWNSNFADVELSIATVEPNSESGIAFDYNSGSNKADALLYEASGDLVVSASRDMFFNVGSGSVNDSDLNHAGARRFTFHSFYKPPGPIRQKFLIFSGSTSPVGAKFEAGRDTNFYVSGNIGGRNSNNNSIGVFGGDLHVSGNLSVGGTGGGMSSWTLQSDGGSNETVSDGEIVDIAGGGGITTATSNSPTSVTVSVDYSAGGNSVIDACPASASPATADTFLFQDADDNAVKVGTIANLISLVPGTTWTLRGDNVGGGSDQTISGGDTVDITGGKGIITLSGTPADGLTVDVEYDGSNNVILEATDGTSITVDTDADRLLISDTDDSNKVKFIKPSQLGSGGSSEWTDESNSLLRPTDSSGNRHLGLGGTGTSFTGFDILLKHDGEARFNIGENDADFRVSSPDKKKMFYIDSGRKNITLNADSSFAAADAALEDDISILVSGSAGSKWGSSRGAVLHTGDTITSGSITGLHARYANIRETNQLGSNVNDPEVSTADITPHTVNIQADDHYVIVHGTDYQAADAKTGAGEAGTLAQVVLPPSAEFGKGRVLYVKMTFRGFADGIFTRAGVRILAAAGERIDDIPNPFSYGMNVRNSVYQLISNGDNRWFVVGDPFLIPGL